MKLSLFTNNIEEYLQKDAIIDYEIDIENTTGDLEQVINGSLSQMSTSRIKVALENRTVVNDENPMLVNPTYFSELEIFPASNEKEGFVLHKTSISGNDADYYRLYMWIPEVDREGNELSISQTGENSISNQAFSIQINVQAIGKNKS